MVCNGGKEKKTNEIKNRVCSSISVCDALIAIYLFFFSLVLLSSFYINRLTQLVQQQKQKPFRTYVNIQWNEFNRIEI